MIKNYIKIAWRNLLKSKLYSAINIIGLSIGISACILIGLYIHNELSYDQFHLNSNNIYRASMVYSTAGPVNEAAVSGSKVGPEFKRTFPNVMEYVRTYVTTSSIKKGELVFDENKMLFADSVFFSVFSFKLLAGDSKTAIDAPDKIVLTQSSAAKLFPQQNAIGEILRYGGSDYKVSGICENPPQNSQIKFDFVISFSNLGNAYKTETWWNANWVTYLLIDNQTNIDQFENQINAYMDSDLVREQTGSMDPNFLHYRLEPFNKVHLHSKLEGLEPNGNIQYIYIFGIIGILILLIAGANYTNLATAQAMGRGGEIGTRKVLGATRNQVFSQFIGEAVVLTSVATVFALMITLFAIPFFNNVSGKSFVFGDVLSFKVLILGPIFALIISFLAGIYPAVVLSGTKALTAMKSSFELAKGNGNVLRKSLIVAQFSISIFLISVTAIIISQVNFLKKTNLGYDRNHVLVIPMNQKISENYELLKPAIQNVIGVSAVTASYDTPEYVAWGDGISATGANGPVEISLNAMPVDLDFAQTLGMQFAAGRDFQKYDFDLMDTTNNSVNYKLPYIINETLAKMIGWTPEEAIGKTIEHRALGPIVGVLKDFHFQSLHQSIGPLLQFLDKNSSRKLLVKMDGGQMKETLKGLENLFAARMPGQPFNYHFLDDDYNKLYLSEQRTTSLFKAAAFLAILLATLGLFGLAAFMTFSRTKEIGIRRVLGATLFSISQLFVRQFIFLIVVAVVVAIPMAWYAGNYWLQDFAYKIELEWWHFALAGTLVLLIAVATISYQSIRVCLLNPIKSLRSE
ncbi:MAG TPA: ABC transporter permease [Saprospiraceae bacterium]|nr:ABC transporter permease [Saprospiraceae bacterium]HPN68222.1 ABC transporter permease [Saprospiraceae bacterium]